MNSKFGSVNSEIITALQEISGDEFVFTDKINLREYGHDETEDLVFMPEVLVKPANSQEISDIVKLANKFCIPITPSGGKTGLSGGALPVHGGINLSLERLNKIIEIDRKNGFVVCEAGIITETLKDEVAKHGLFYPPDPASKGSSFIGGNIAENSGGPRCVKYGVTVNYVTGLEIVLPTGEIIVAGGKLLKDVAGYNLIGLFTGSEGTLGIITRATLKLVPLPTHKISILVPFEKMETAASAVSEIFKAGVTPSACEFLEIAAIKAAEKHLEQNWQGTDGAEAQLLLEIDGFSEENVTKDAETAAEACLDAGALDAFLIEGSEKQNKIWDMRSAVGEAVKALATYKEEDTTVPRYQLPELVRGVHKICKTHDVKVIVYGHAGDGNLHCNLLKIDISDEKWDTELDSVIREIFILTKSLNGTITGEHGIGFVQKRFFKEFTDSASFELQKKLKQTLDPNGIMNPGKIFQD